MFSSKNAPRSLAALLGMVPDCMPSYTQYDLGLWNCCYETLRRNPMNHGKALEYVEIGNALSTAIEQMPRSVLGVLASASTCSFIPVASNEELNENFGRDAVWESVISDVRNDYYRIRFAVEYWAAVQKAAMSRSCESCANYFLLDAKIVDMIAHATTRNIIDFCHANPRLHQFKLTCPIDDCLSIIRIASDPALEALEKNLRLRMAKAMKCSHSSSFTAAHSCEL